MQKQCASCGRPFEAKRQAAKFCGDTCRKRAQRGPAQLSAVPDVDPPEDPVGGKLTKATTAELEAAGRLESALGVAALTIAQRIDGFGLMDTGAGVAALIKEHRAALAEAVKDAEQTADALDQINVSAALKLIAGGA